VHAQFEKSLKQGYPKNYKKEVPQQAVQAEETKVDLDDLPF